MLLKTHIHKIVKTLRRKPSTLTPRWQDAQMLSIYSQHPTLSDSQASSAAKLLVRYHDTDLPPICSQLNIPLPAKEELVNWDPVKSQIPSPVIPTVSSPVHPTTNPSLAGVSPSHPSSGPSFDFSNLMLNHPRSDWIRPLPDFLSLLIPWIPKEIGLSLRNEIKTIPGKRFNFDEKRWEIPTMHALDAARILDRYIPLLAQAIRAGNFVQLHAQEEQTRRDLSNAKSLDDFPGYAWLDDKLDELTPDGLQPYPYQKAGVAFLHSMGGHAVLGDEMGLGKTIISILYWLINPRPTLIVCPASVKFNWAEEIRRWAPAATVSVFMPSMSKKAIKQWEARGIDIWLKKGLPEGRSDFVIINYDNVKGKSVKDENNYSQIQLGDVAQTLVNMQFQQIVFDECQNLANYFAQKVQGCVGVARTCHAVVGLSGTPITVTPASFYTVLNLVKPSEFPRWREFINQFCASETYTYRDPNTGEKKTQINWRKSEVTNWPILHNKLKTCMIRRLAKDVLDELPDLIRQVIRVQITTGSTYNSLLKEFKKFPSLDILAKIRVECVRRKFKLAMEQIVGEFTPNEGCIVFYHHHEVGNMLQHAFEKEKISVGRLDGTMSAGVRQGAIQSFQNKLTDAFLVSIKAGGTGLTLTRTNRVYFIEPVWDPSDIKQAEKRAHRIGQTQTVHAVHFLAGGTVEELFYEQLQAKDDMQGKILEGVERRDVLSAVTGWLG